MEPVSLKNLLNAEQAMRPHGGTLRVSAVPFSAPAAPARRNGTGKAPAAREPWVEVELFNDGPPIPAEVLPSIFEPLFTTKPKDEGTGLGLAICQRIVREHGGEIHVQSDPTGTAFRIRLPGLDG